MKMGLHAGTIASCVRKKRCCIHTVHDTLSARSICCHSGLFYRCKQEFRQPYQPLSLRPSLASTVLLSWSSTPDAKPEISLVATTPLVKGKEDHRQTRVMFLRGIRLVLDPRGRAAGARESRSCTNREASGKTHRLCVVSRLQNTSCLLADNHSDGESDSADPILLREL